MNEIAQFTALRTWLLDITQLTEIIRAHPDAPRPQGRYGVLNLISAERVNWHSDLITQEAAEPETDGFPFEQIPVETWQNTWSFHIYGPDGIAAASRITSAARSDAALLQLHPLVLHRTSLIRRLPEIVGTTWEDRIQVDLFVHYRVEHAFGVDIVESASAEFSDPPKDFGTASVEIE